LELQNKSVKAWKK